MKSMVFDGKEIDLITRNGEVWVRGVQIAHALGYKDDSAVSRIYSRYKDEFTGSMTCTVKLTDQHGQMKKTRIFSLRGSHLVAMFARTEKAKAFRRWVLDILDAIHNGSEYVRRQHEAALKAMEDGREQASNDGRGLSEWRWAKRALQISVDYWGDRRQLVLELN